MQNVDNREGGLKNTGNISCGHRLWMVPYEALAHSKTNLVLSKWKNT